MAAVAGRRTHAIILLVAACYINSSEINTCEYIEDNDKPIALPFFPLQQDLDHPLRLTYVSLELIQHNL